jgi:hypothetical protein
MSIQNFYENGAGKNLTKTQIAPLEKAKNKFPKPYGRPQK